MVTHGIISFERWRMKYLLGWVLFSSVFAAQAEGFGACERAALPATIIAKLKANPEAANPLEGAPGTTVVAEAQSLLPLFSNKVVHFAIMDILSRKNYGKIKNYRNVADVLSNFTKRYEVAEIERFLSDVVDLLVLRLSPASEISKQAKVAKMAKHYNVSAESIYSMNNALQTYSAADYATIKVALFFVLAQVETATQVAKLQSKGAKFLAFFGARPSRAHRPLDKTHRYNTAVKALQIAQGDEDILVEADRDLLRLFPQTRNRAVRAYLLGTIGIDHQTVDHLEKKANALSLDALTREMLTEKDAQLVAAFESEAQGAADYAAARDRALALKARKRVAEQEASVAADALSQRVEPMRKLIEALDERRTEIQKFLGDQEAVSLKARGLGMPQTEFESELAKLEEAQVDTDEAYDKDEMGAYASAVESLLTDNAETLSVTQFLRIADVSVNEVLSWDLSDEECVEYAEWVLQKLHAGAARMPFSNDDLSQLIVYIQKVVADLALTDDQDQEYADLIREYDLKIWGVTEYPKSVIKQWEDELAMIGQKITEINRAIQDALSAEPSASPEEIFVGLKRGLAAYETLRDSNNGGVAATEKARRESAANAEATVAARRQHQKNQADLATSRKELEALNAEILALEEQERAISSGQGVAETALPAAPTAPALDPIPQAIAAKSTRILGGMESRMTRAHAQAVEDSDLSVWYEAFKTELSERQETLTESDLVSFVVSSLDLFVDSDDWDYDDLGGSDFEAYKDIVEAVQEAAKHVHQAKSRLGVTAQNMEKLRASLARLKDCFPDTNYTDEFAALSELIDDVWESTDGSVTAAPVEAPVEKLDAAGITKAVAEKKNAREALLTKIRELETTIQAFRP